MTDYAEEIAKACLSIGAIKLAPADPFTWASGFRMPIYNDNRMLLGTFRHRELVARGLAELIRKQNIPCDMIAGTSTAGIAPAKSVADILNLPLILLEAGQAFEFKDLGYGYITPPHEPSYNSIASTCPWAIPYGVFEANHAGMPFMYVRQSRKGHGTRQQIEGNPLRGQHVLLLAFYRGDDYSAEAVRALEEKGISIEHTISENISRELQPSGIRGRRIVLIEDLISTGSSSAAEVMGYREIGAEVTHCFSIFSYCLDRAAEEFRKAGCKAMPLVTYDGLLRTAEETRHISPSDKAMLDEWRADPFGWGAKHGFPKVETK